MGKIFSVGFSEVNITPPVGLSMDGYVARNGVSSGVHDPLLAQVLVMDDGDLRVALVTLDVMGVSVGFTEALRSSLAAILEMRADAIMVCASHTHSGPSGLQDWFPIDGHPTLNTQLVEMVSSHLAIAAHSALDQRTPAQLFYGIGTIENIGTDRNRHVPAPDPLVSALRFERPNGTPIAVVFHYACHPTVLGPQLAYSADFPGAARRHLQSRYPACMYLNGAAGNISTRFSRRDQTFEEVDRIGKLLSDRVFELLDRSQRCDTNLSVSSQTVDLPLRKFSVETIRNFQSSGNQRIDQTRAEGAIIEGQLALKFGGQLALQAELSTIHIGPFSLLGVPGEAFNELAAELRRISPTALVVGYVNNYLGYFPTAQAIEDRTYEALSSPYNARAHKIIEDALLNLA